MAALWQGEGAISLHTKECQICWVSYDRAESPCHLTAKSLNISRLTKNRKTAIVFAYSDQVTSYQRFISSISKRMTNSLISIVGSCRLSPVRAEDSNRFMKYVFHVTSRVPHQSTICLHVKRQRLPFWWSITQWLEDPWATQHITCTLCQPNKRTRHQQTNCETSFHVYKKLLTFACWWSPWREDLFDFSSYKMPTTTPLLTPPLLFQKLMMTHFPK